MTTSLLDQAQSSGDDQTKTTSFENELTPAGPTFARFVGYAEVGKRKQRPYQGTPRADCAEVRFTFELNGPKHMKEIVVDGETKKVPNVIGIKLTKKSADNSGFIKLFRKMTYGRDDKKNFPSMLGEGFLITIIHAPGKDKEGKDVVWANMKDAEFNYLIGAPMQTNPATGELVKFDIPEATIPLRLLMWDKPSKEQWASLFIDGTRTVKRDGKDVEISKNWLQEDIVENAVNFPGSPLEMMIGKVDDLELPGDGGAPDHAGQNNPEAHGTPEPKTTAPTVPQPSNEAPQAPTSTPPVSTDTPPSDDAAEAAQALFDQLGV